MRTHSRARRLALTALCAGTSLGAAGLAVAPGQALAATKACSNVYASGSTLQTPVQEFPTPGAGPGATTFTQLAGPDGAFKATCTSTPQVGYNTTTALGTEDLPSTGTGSGHGEAEFALDTTQGALTPSDSSNGAWLDGFIGTDAPPNSTQLANAAASTGTDAETLPILQAPIAVVVNLPSGCTTAKTPIITNQDLSSAFDDGISWSALLTDAGAKPSAGCPTSSGPTVEVRYDSSGTSFAFKQYLSQINSSVWSPYVATTGQGTANAWPNTVSDSYSGGTNSGSGGEADAVYDTAGSIGYVNLADAVAAGFTKWSASSSQFFTEVQNNGTGTTGVTGAEPDSGTKQTGNCYTTYTGTLPSSANDPDYENVFVANPKQKTTATYPICTLTYDVGWNSYSTVDQSNGDAGYYTGQYAGETPAGVAATTQSYLKWLVGTSTKQGQTVIPAYYAKLPPNIDALAKKTALVIGQS